MPSIEELQIIVDASTEVLRSELAQANAGIDRFERNVNTSMKKVNTSFGSLEKAANLAKGAVAGMLSGALFGTIASGAKAVLDFADDLGTAADQANINVERFQTLREAFRSLEIDGEAFEKILQKLIQAQGDVANGTKNGATKALDELGVSADIVSGKIKTTDQLLDAIAAAFGGIEDPAKKAALAGDLVGSRLGVQFAAAIRDGGVALRELEGQMRATGTVIDEEMVKELAAANEEWDRFTTETKQRGVIWAANTIRYLRDVAEELAKLPAWLRFTPVGLTIAAFRGNPEDAVDGFSKQRDALEKQIAADEDALKKVGKNSAIAKEIEARLKQNRINLRGLEGDIGEASPRRTRDPDLGVAPSPKKREPTPAELRLGDGSIPPQVSQQGPLIDTPVMQENAEFWRMINDLIGEAAQETGNLKISLAETFNDQMLADLEAIEEYGLRDLSRGLAEAAIYGDDVGDVLENSFKRAAAAMLEAAIQAKALGPLLEDLKGGGGGGFFSSIGSLVSSFFGGARAAGGPVVPGKAYLVGERGPELIVPRTAGQVIANDNLRGMSGGNSVTINVSVDARGATDPAMVEAAATRAVYAAAPAIIRAAEASTLHRAQRPRLPGSWG